MHRKQPKLVDVATSWSLDFPLLLFPVRWRRAVSSGRSVGAFVLVCANPILHRHTQSDISQIRSRVLGVVAAKLKLNKDVQCRRMRSASCRALSLTWFCKSVGFWACVINRVRKRAKGVRVGCAAAGNSARRFLWKNGRWREGRQSE